MGVDRCFLASLHWSVQYVWYTHMLCVIRCPFRSDMMIMSWNVWSWWKMKKKFMHCMWICTLGHLALFGTGQTRWSSTTKRNLELDSELRNLLQLVCICSDFMFTFHSCLEFWHDVTMLPQSYFLQFRGSWEVTTPTPLIKRVIPSKGGGRGSYPDKP